METDSGRRRGAVHLRGGGSGQGGAGECGICRGGLITHTAGFRMDSAMGRDGLDRIKAAAEARGISARAAIY